jgi:hypothetical protein
MPAELPIACSLSTTELRQRLAAIADLGRDALIELHAEPRQARLRFAAGAGVRSRLEAIVAAESECCAFLAFDISDEPDALVLTSDAPEGADVVLTGLVDAFRGNLRARIVSAEEDS